MHAAGCVPVPSMQHHPLATHGMDPSTPGRVFLAMRSAPCCSSTCTAALCLDHTANCGGDGKAASNA